MKKTHQHTPRPTGSGGGLLNHARRILCATAGILAALSAPATAAQFTVTGSGIIDNFSAMFDPVRYPSSVFGVDGESVTFTFTYDDSTFTRTLDGGNYSNYTPAAPIAVQVVGSISGPLTVEPITIANAYNDPGGNFDQWNYISGINGLTQANAWSSLGFTTNPGADFSVVNGAFVSSYATYWFPSNNVGFGVDYFAPGHTLQIGNATWTVTAGGPPPPPPTTPAVDDAVTSTTGSTRVYVLANDGTGDVTITTVTGAPGATISADGRSIIVPEGFTGTFTYTTDAGTTASVTVNAGVPVSAAKKYTGLLYDADGSIAGWVSVNHSVKNRATAQIRIGATRGTAIIPLSKTAPANGSGTSSIGTLDLELGEDNIMTATLTAGADTFTADLRPAVTSATVAKHHIALASIDAAIPGGGYAVARVKNNGSVVAVGKLPDGRPFKAGTALGDNGKIGLYCLESKDVNPFGVIAGELIFADLAATDVTGEIAWSKPAQNVGAKGTHLAGVDTILTANGCLYSGTITLSGAATLTLSGGNLAVDESNAVSVTTGVPTLTGSMRNWTPKDSTGTFEGKVMVPGFAKPVDAYGLYLPKSNSAWGYFPGTTLGGRIELTVP